ncbi:MAG TPA: hypothetical protein V6C76_04160 [Drouetiella sp.]
MDKDFKERLKEDVHLKVSDSDGVQENPEENAKGTNEAGANEAGANEAGANEAKANEAKANEAGADKAGQAGAINSNTNKSETLKSDTNKSELNKSEPNKSEPNNSEPNKSEVNYSGAKSATAVASEQTALVDKAVIVADRREREKAFLAAHKKRLIRSRMIICVALILGYMSIQALFWYAYGTGPKMDFTYNRLIPMSLFGSIGERDFAYSQLSQITNSKTEETPGLLGIRTKIIDEAIADMEKSGHPAILTRLSAEQTQMQYGDREKGLKIGDALIAKYPNLASNYLWRARVDFEQAHFADVIKEEDQALVLLNKDIPETQRAWAPELYRGYWSGLYSGQFDKSSQYIEFMKEHGKISPESVAAMRSMQLIATAEALGAPVLRNTDLWTPDLERVYKQSMEKASKLAEKSPPWNEDVDELGYIGARDLRNRANLALGKFDDMEKSISGFDFEYLAKAQLRLAQGKYAEAVKNVDDYPYRYDLVERSFYKSSALVKLHRPQEAAKVAQAGLDRFQRWDMTSLLYLPLRLVKAHALADSHQFVDALKECDLLLKINPNLIEAHAIKLQVYKEQGKTAEANSEHSIIQQALQEALKVSERVLKQ